MDAMIGDIKAGTRPVVACAMSDRDVERIGRAQVRHIDLVELRVDLFRRLSPDYVAGVFTGAKRRLSRPILGTVRLPHEGGRAAMDEETRYALFETIVLLADAVDIEIRSRIFPDVVALAHRYGKPAIASYHDLEKTPADDMLLKMVSKARRGSADIIKLALMANGIDDVVHLLRFTMDHRKDRLITVSLGRVGMVSRVVNPLFGSLVTYGYVGRPKADGQMRVDRLAEQIRMYWSGR
ncbi:MAG: type I 3-dehydroquinate dehydratase [Deltaproteobacteria bacterium]|nr:type I 3-dehydroquinate dehydratase [Deltaproteobacteria bacterium]MCL5277790.1 type I 3-dehydroquinate dehydratase [Deltaproteobacteria bacterium]